MPVGVAWGSTICRSSASVTSPSMSSNFIPEASIQSVTSSRSRVPFVLRALHEQRRVFEGRVLTAVVEVQMRVDHHRHIDRREVVGGQRVATVLLTTPNSRSTSSGPPQPVSTRMVPSWLMQDHVAMDGPLIALDVEMAEIEAFDLHQTGRRPHNRIRLKG